ncbi:MAG TPA: sensor histidine kinase [Solirubrobacteraceae bacterium]|nr:sensor histidine kinase [Solirubrobacteraceae bacterium]
MRRLRHDPVAQFAVAGLVAMILIGLATAAVSRHTGTSEAIRDAKELTAFAGRGIVEPNLTRGVLAGNPAALRRFDALVHRRVLRDGIVRVKIWSRDGHVIYSDEPRLIGARYPLGGDELTALRVEADVSDLSAPENRFERSYDKLLEVYLPIRAPGGRWLLFEAYQRYSAVSANGWRLWLAFVPALLGGLLLLQLVNLPLARSLARRLREGRREREALLEHALDASQTERRLIAADLHDGVVQDLLGVSYSLAAGAARINGSDPEASAALREGATRTRETVSAVRALLIDIYPPSLQSAGLAAALGDLATTYGFRGVQTTVAVPPGLALPASTERLLFRCAQEALRNAYKHAGASHARIHVSAVDDGVRAEIADDGHGFDVAVLAERAEQGHLGLTLIRDLVEEAGGRFEVSSSPSGGTTVRVEVPR